ncbi:MAG TPA: acyl carrier protein [Clostridia bacterium]|nr:acyl carrier protein [Clostridia bacterium]
MEKQEIVKKVSEIVKGYSQFNSDNIEVDADLRENYGVDSIILVEMLVDLECEFNVTFDSSMLTYDNFSTVAAISDYVYGKISEDGKELVV